MLGLYAGVSVGAVRLSTGQRPLLDPSLPPYRDVLTDVVLGSPPCEDVSGSTRVGPVSDARIDEHHRTSYPAQDADRVDYHTERDQHNGVPRHVIHAN